MIGLAHVLDLLKQLIEPHLAIAHDQQAVARIAPRPPKPISLVRAQRRWQSIARPEKVDRARFAVVLREDCATRAFSRGHLGPGLGHRTCQFGPAELVRTMLGKYRGLVAMLGMAARGTSGVWSTKPQAR